MCDNVHDFESTIVIYKISFILVFIALILSIIYQITNGIIVGSCMCLCCAGIFLLYFREFKKYRSDLIKEYRIAKIQNKCKAEANKNELAQLYEYFLFIYRV